MAFDIEVNRILEMYLNLDTQGTLYPKDPTTNKVIKSDSFSIPDNAKVIDTIHGYDVYQLTDGDWFEFYVKSPQEQDASLRLAGTSISRDMYRVREVDASNANKFPVISLYEYLIDKGIKLLSDNEHSIGGKKIWEKLIANPKFKFFRAIENKIKSAGVARFSEWIPLKKNELANPNQFWDDSSRTSITSSTVLMAVKK
jgi:hypothetical protein